MGETIVLFVFLMIAAGFTLRKAAPVFACWATVRRKGGTVGLWTIWSLYLRNLPFEALTAAHLTARQAEVRIPLAELVAHARAGGDVRAVVHAYVAMRQSGSEIDFARVCEIELADLEPEEVEVL